MFFNPWFEISIWGVLEYAKKGNGLEKTFKTIKFMILIRDIYFYHWSKLNINQIQ